MRGVAWPLFVWLCLGGGADASDGDALAPQWGLLDSVEGIHNKDVDARVESSSEESGALKRLQRMVARRSSGILEVDEEFVEDFLLNPSRDYFLALLVTAPDEACEPCKIVKEGFVTVAALAKRNGITTSDGDPIFFGTLAATRLHGLARMLRVTEVPQIFMIGPSTLSYFKASERIDRPSRLSELSRIECPKSERVTLVKDKSFKDELVSKLKSKAGLQNSRVFDEPPSLYARARYGTAILAAVGAGLFGFSALQKWVIANPIVMPISAVIVFALNSAGLMYSIQHESPLYGMSSQGTIEYIMASGRGQYLGEGLIMAPITCAISLAIYAAVTCPEWRLWDFWSRFTAGSQNRDERKPVGTTVIATALLCLVLAGVCYLTLTSVFHLKNPYINPVFFPTGHTGSWRNDRGYAPQ